MNRLPKQVEEKLKKHEIIWLSFNKPKRRGYYHIHVINGRDVPLRGATTREIASILQDEYKLDITYDVFHDEWEAYNEILDIMEEDKDKVTVILKAVEKINELQ